MSTKNLQFKSEFTQESTYILGLLWADGNVSNDNYRITLSSTYPDSKEIIPILYKSSDNWKLHLPPKNSSGWKQGYKFMLNDIELGKFLSKNGYTPYRREFPKILYLLPKNLIPYWFLGVVDGDGCFYFNKKYKLRQFQITSNINQDWKFMENLLNSLNIEFSIDRREVECGTKKRSNIRIFGYKNIFLFGEYIYSNISKDNIGLARKYNKWLECIDLEGYRPTRGVLDSEIRNKIIYFTQGTKIQKV